MNPVPDPVALRATALAKTYGGRTVVAGVDLNVPAGSHYGLVGPNGAGKTTTLSMATGLLRPDGGAVRVFGVDIWDDPVPAKSLLGVLPDDLALPERLTGRELLVYLGQLHRLPARLAADRADELLTALGLDRDDSTAIAGYSAGMRKKIGLATALIHGPRLLVLDEPFEAVDPVSAASIRAILAQFVARGGSVLISSHVMTLVERLCDRVAVIAHGTVVAEGTVAEVRGDGSLDDAFVRLAGAQTGDAGGLSWL